MLTRFVRNQLIIFTVASVLGIAAMVLVYMQVPTLLGIGRMTVKVELPRTGGLYRFSNVTYRGVQIGRVTDVKATRDGAVATLSVSSTSICNRGPIPVRICTTGRSSKPRTPRCRRRSDRCSIR